MRWIFLVALLGCKGSDGTPAAPTAGSAAAKPANEMDEKMRHCPLALDGAASTLSDIDGGVRFAIKAPESEVAEARRRARHVVEFAAKKTREGHSGYDAKGGGHMRNCPVVTDGVTITATDIDGGAQLDITTAPDQVGPLRAETRTRVQKFPFVGATITIAPAP